MDNSSFAYTAYIVIAVLIGGYIIRLWRKN